EQALGAGLVRARGLAGLLIDRDEVGQKADPYHPSASGEVAAQEALLEPLGDDLLRETVARHDDDALLRMGLGEKADEAGRVDDLVSLRGEVVADRGVSLEPFPRPGIGPEDGATRARGAGGIGRGERVDLAIVAADNDQVALHRRGRVDGTAGA